MDNAVGFDVTTVRGRRAVHRWERTSVGDVFERLTWSYPDETAIAGMPGAHGEPQFARVTNRQADAVCNQLAHALAARGLEPGDRVLLFCENSVEAFLAKIGIAKAGMVAVPLNPALAPDVVTHLIELTEPKLAIVDVELWPRAEQTFTAAGLEVAAFVQVGGALTPTFGELLAGQPETEPDVEIHGDDVWELLFTSGTTSMPKGAMVTHSSTYLAALNFALSLSRGVRHECDLKVATFLPMIYHVGDQIFTFSAFLSGGSIVLGRRPVPDAVAEAIA